MGTMQSADNLQMHGPQREKALADFISQMREWNIAVPEAEALVLDFGIDDYQNTGLIEYWLANEMAAGYCGKYLCLFEGQSCPAHWHHTKHETFYPLKGEFEVTLENNVTKLQAGQSMAIPTTQVHSFKAVGGNALLLELSMPCDPRDNHFQDPRIMQWLSRNV